MRTLRGGSGAAGIGGTGSLGAATFAFKVLEPPSTTLIYPLGQPGQSQKGFHDAQTRFRSPFPSAGLTGRYLNPDASARIVALHRALDPDQRLLVNHGEDAREQRDRRDVLAALPLRDEGMRGAGSLRSSHAPSHATAQCSATRQ